MAITFAPVGRATVEKTPNYTQAAVGQAAADNAAWQNENAVRAQNLNMMGDIYGSLTSEVDPIGDYVSDALRGFTGNKIGPDDIYNLDAGLNAGQAAGSMFDAADAAGTAGDMFGAAGNVMGPLGAIGDFAQGDYLGGALGLGSSALMATNPVLAGAMLVGSLLT